MICELSDKISISYCWSSKFLLKSINQSNIFFPQLIKTFTAAYIVRIMLLKSDSNKKNLKILNEH